MKVVVNGSLCKLYCEWKRELILKLAICYEEGKLFFFFCCSVQAILKLESEKLLISTLALKVCLSLSLPTSLAAEAILNFYEANQGSGERKKERFTKNEEKHLASCPC